jgi:GNAT superfamily N-acetyltransferase
MAVPVVLRDLDPAGDRAALERLWAAAIGDVWALLPAGLDLLRTGVVAEVGGDPVGVVGVEAGDDGNGGVQLLLVDPAVQRRGIGTRLLQAGIERLTALGVTTVALGSGATTTCGPACRTTCPARPGSSWPGAGGSRTACSTSSPTSTATRPRPEPWSGRSAPGCRSGSRQHPSAKRCSP